MLDSDDRGAEVREALETTENLVLRLDPDLAATGNRPGPGGIRPRASGEDSLRDADEMEKVRLLRQDLSELDTEEAAQKLGELIGDTSNNAELLDRSSQARSRPRRQAPQEGSRESSISSESRSGWT